MIFIAKAIFWVFIGLLFIKLIRYQRKDKGVSRCEKKTFNLKYWLSDNWIGILINILFTIISVGFTSDLVAHVNLEYLKFGENPMFIYLLLGFYQQLIIDLIQKVFR